jgi:hypothetical protein
MPTWILRKSVDGERVGPPRPCAIDERLARALGGLTEAENTAQLLAENESATAVVDGQRKIYSGDRLVGYIVRLSTE